MCLGSGEEYCDECFTRMQLGDTEENWPCEECKKFISCICPMCEAVFDEPLPHNENGVELCKDCQGEFASYDEEVQQDGHK